MLRKIKPSWNFQRDIGQRGPHGTKGQSLVEMAIITPLLLLLFIGVLEVGWAVRGYIVLVNADREATRFAARGQYLDFRQTERTDIGYDYVAAHTLDSISAQLDFDVFSEDPNATLIVSHYLVDTGKPCADPPCNNDCKADKHNKHGGCDCSTPDRREPDYALDDLILHPGISGYEHFTALYGIPRKTQINHDELAAQLKEQNDAFNCSLNAKDPAVPWVPNSVVAVEAFYEQSQLLGVPIVSNYFTDPIPMYAHTVMRISPGGRESAGMDCLLLPITVYIETLDVPVRTKVDIREGTGSGNFGWLRWTDDSDLFNSTNSEEYLAAALKDPKMAKEFREPPHKDPNDEQINNNDWVWGLTGNINADEVRDNLDDLIAGGRTYTIPVWGKAEGTGANVVYHIVGFALVKLEAYSLTTNEKTISATFMGWANGACPGNDH